MTENEHCPKAYTSFDDCTKLAKEYQTDTESVGSVRFKLLKDVSEVILDIDLPRLTKGGEGREIFAEFMPNYPQRN